MDDATFLSEIAGILSDDDSMGYALSDSRSSCGGNAQPNSTAPVPILPVPRHSNVPDRPPCPLTARPATGPPRKVNQKVCRSSGPLSACRTSSPFRDPLGYPPSTPHFRLLPSATARLSLLSSTVFVRRSWISRYRLCSTASSKKLPRLGGPVIFPLFKVWSSVSK